MGDMDNKIAQYSYWEMEMTRLTGSIPKDKIKEMKEDLREGIDFYKERFQKVTDKGCPQIDMWHYKDNHNHIDLRADNNEFDYMCRQGIEYLFNDFHEFATGRADASVTEIIPGIFVNDLVVKVRPAKNSGSSELVYYYYKYNEQEKVLYLSYYEKRMLPVIDTQNEKGLNVLSAAHHSERFAKAILPQQDYEPVIDLVCSWALPVDFAFLTLMTGMHSKWKDGSFTNYPAFIAWDEDSKYISYAEEYRRNQVSKDDLGILQEGLEHAFGFHRYLINLAENREKISVTPDKERNKTLRKPVTEEEKKEYRRNKKSIITISEAVKIYANNQEAVRQIRHPKKCEYRYTVREHVRHYKSGKVIRIKSYDKNKDLPFRPHKYVGA